jgi:hypothetical protein
MMTGYMYGGREGMYAAAANHLMQDLMSDTPVRTVGGLRDETSMSHNAKLRAC